MPEVFFTEATVAYWQENNAVCAVAVFGRAAFSLRLSGPPP
jgi:hypothetical protein